MYENVFEKLKEHWREQIFPNDDYVRRWATVIPMMEEIYEHWLETVESTVKSAEVKEIVEQALKRLKP